MKARIMNARDEDRPGEARRPAIAPAAPAGAEGPVHSRRQAILAYAVAIGGPLTAFAFWHALAPLFGETARPFFLASPWPRRPGLAASARGSPPRPWAPRWSPGSCYAQDADLQKSREAGFDHHFSKPVDLARLFDLLRLSIP